MSRIAAAFRRAQDQGRAAFVGYLTGHDPDMEGSYARLVAAVDGGLDVLELGVPFSDPTADGPDIQAAMVRARSSGATLDRVLELSGRLRERFPDLPIVLFSYANPLAAKGEAFVEALKAGGIDGLLVVDVPAESAEWLRGPARAAGLDWIGLCAPTTTPDRLARTLAATSGFVYAVALTGVTGAKLDATSEALDAHLKRIKDGTDLPVAVGFGVRDPEQARRMAARADGVVVGSALVRAGLDGPDALKAKVTELAAGMGRG